MIKAIAVDMDGTFLNSQSTYDHERFAKVFQQLQAHHIQFIVASGNPIYQLKMAFPDYVNDLCFVAENGVECFDHNQLVYCGEITSEAIQGILQLHLSIPGSTFLLSGLHHAFVFKDENPDFIQRIRHHYPRMVMIDSLTNIDDQIVKLQMDVPGEMTQQMQDQINHDFASQLTAVSSGYGNLDLIVSGLDKATGLKALMKRHGWQNQEIMAFGDGQNDMTMLQLAGESYAMQNGDPRVIQLAKHTAPTNDQNGVLVTIENYLQQLA
ncbi:Cof-type HAD-IIB family hydrolase [uncultured Limosilactobacillus sp.]|uniref:Cof-type HAD-IIB family hydrolase n=1 Tax=uncultured Limosilactobacillus sp. TaxID=2837629 RepID=UPI0025DB6B5A|nr:Cof-type HAD-IIB family hydrolase [uncultured Limosilactobacillus sp.]